MRISTILSFLSAYENPLKQLANLISGEFEDITRLKKFSARLDGKKDDRELTQDELYELCSIIFAELANKKNIFQSLRGEFGEYFRGIISDMFRHDLFNKQNFDLFYHHSKHAETISRCLIYFDYFEGNKKTQFENICKWSFVPTLTERIRKLFYADSLTQASLDHLIKELSEPLQWHAFTMGLHSRSGSPVSYFFGNKNDNALHHDLATKQPIQLMKMHLKN